MSIEHDLLTRMFEDNLDMSRRLLAIGDYAMSAEALASAIEQLHQLAALNKSTSSTKPPLIDV